jgi:hypothetical protein
MRAIDRRIVISILEDHGYERISREGRGVGSSHDKYKKINDDGSCTTYSLTNRKSLEIRVIKDISRITGIPVEGFCRHKGSKKHQSGIGVFAFYSGSDSGYEE